MEYESLLGKLLDDDNDDIIELSPDGENIVKFEQIGVVIEDEQAYAIMHPMELKDDQVVVFRLDEYDEENIDLVEDEELANRILQIYQEGNGKK